MVIGSLVPGALPTQPINPDSSCFNGSHHRDLNTSSANQIAVWLVWLHAGQIEAVEQTTNYL